MPTIMLRGLDPALVARVRAFARESGQSLIESAAKLLEMGLTLHENRRRGAEAVNAARTPQERTEAAQKAAQARWR